jgi:hypothetical protein
MRAARRTRRRSLMMREHGHLEDLPAEDDSPFAGRDHAA